MQLIVTMAEVPDFIKNMTRNLSQINNAQVHTGPMRQMKNGPNIQVTYMTFDQPNDASEFDQAYTGGGHGGNTVNPFYPDSGESIDNTVIELEEGCNDIPLLEINSIADIKNIAIEFGDSKEDVEVVFQKKSFHKKSKIHEVVRAISAKSGSEKVAKCVLNLYDIRTMFVAYLDTYAKLIIDMPVKGTLKINIS